MKLRHVAALVVSLSIVGVSCSSSDDPSVTLYSGRSEDLVGPLLEQFTEATGIEVTVNYLGSEEAALLIDQEGDRSPANVFLSQSPGAMGFLEDAGRLADLDQSILDLVPASVRDNDGQWVGVSGRQRVLVYNQDLVDVASLPSSVIDIAGPQFAGQVGLAPANGSFQDFVTAMRGSLGDEATLAWLTELNANGAVSYANNSSIVAAVGRGEIQVGLVNHYYNYRALDEDPSLRSLNFQFDQADPGAVLIVTAAAVIDGNESNEANQLIEFLLSPSAQEYFATETFEYPLVASVSPAAGIPAASFDAVGDDVLGDLGAELKATRDLIIEAGFEG